MNVYEADYQGSARDKLRDNTAIDVSDEGVVTITVEDREPNRAAAVANAYITELDKQNKRLSSGQATSKRVFLESRLKEIEEELSNIENIPAKQAQIKEMLYELLARESELAKIEEAKSMPTIQVLDEAVVPERRLARGTKRRVMVAGALSLMLGMLLAFVREYIAKVRQREAGQQQPASSGEGHTDGEDGDLDSLEDKRRLISTQRKRLQQEDEAYVR
jgi:uncharacterized protein involved in exopolysaccharide biosynthesis